jgi:hypothetical protein
VTTVIPPYARTNAVSVPIWSAASTEPSVPKPEPSTHSFFYSVHIATSDWVATPVQTREKVRMLSPGLRRILARQPEAIRRARELRTILGDPIEELVQVLQDVPVEDDVWDRISQEPYG